MGHEALGRKYKGDSWMNIPCLGSSGADELAVGKHQGDMHHKEA